MIGLSLSLCIADILAGRVAEADVERIVAATSFHNASELETVIAQYQRSYWQTDPRRGAALARKYYTAGLIDQPRLRGEAVHVITEGKYTDETGLKTWPRMV
jgi:hypothetical protein